MSYLVLSTATTTTESGTMCLERGRTDNLPPIDRCCNEGSRSRLDCRVRRKKRVGLPESTKGSNTSSLLLDNLLNIWRRRRDSPGQPPLSPETQPEPHPLFLRRQAAARKPGILSTMKPGATEMDARRATAVELAAAKGDVREATAVEIGLELAVTHHVAAGQLAREDVQGRFHQEHRGRARAYVRRGHGERGQEFLNRSHREDRHGTGGRYELG